MRRPLAVFGLAFAIVLLVVLRLPALWLYAAAGVLAAAFAVCFALLRRWAGGLVPLLLAAALCACCLRAGYDALFVRPVLALEGRSIAATVRVLEVSPGYGEDAVHATVKVLQAGEGAPAGFKLELRDFPPAQPGDLLQAEIELYPYTSTQSRGYGYAKGIFVQARVLKPPRAAGVSHTLATRLRLLQYAAAANIRGRLPARLSGVAAAMAVGDRRFVPQIATQNYRAAGLSHLLVVSGLHLSILCGFLQGLLFRTMRRKRLAAGICMGFVLLFMVFTGLTPSVVRSGIVWLLIFAGGLVGRRADAYTSLGFSAVLLLLQNPYAVGGVGLLLSFTATLGAIGGGGMAERLRLRWQQAAAPPPLRLARWLARAALVPLAVSLATLPVLVWAGFGVSLLAAPANILAVWLMPAIVVCGLVMAIPPALPVLGSVLGYAAALVCGTLLVWLEKLTALCAALPGAVVATGGLFALVVVLAVYALVLAGRRARQTLAGVLAGGFVLAVGLFLHSALSAGTVRVALAGGGNNPSLVVVQDGRAAVLYRSRQSLAAAQRVLQAHGVRECVLFIDLRQMPESTEYMEAFAPQQVVTAKTDLVAGGVYRPFGEVEITVVRQGGGTVACVDVAGYKVGLAAGSVNLQPYALLNVLVAGSGTVQGGYAGLLYTGSPPAWADGAVPMMQAEGDAFLWIRPGKSVVFREVRDAAG